MLPLLVFSWLREAIEPTGGAASACGGCCSTESRQGGQGGVIKAAHLFDIKTQRRRMPSVTNRESPYPARCQHAPLSDLATRDRQSSRITRKQQKTNALPAATRDDSRPLPSPVFTASPKRSLVSTDKLGD
jgi:hypothetical protein